MSHFKFRLQTVQRLRERLRDQAAESLGQARLAVVRLNEQVQQLQVEMQFQAGLQTQASQGIIQTQTVLDSQRYQLWLASELAACRDKIALIEQEVQRRQQLLIQRERDVQAMEKLRQSQLAQWRQARLAAEQSRLDEWASFRHWNSPGRGGRPPAPP